MKKTIIELWNGSLEPIREPEVRSEELHLLVQYLDRHSDRLRDLLDDDGKETLQKLKDCYDEIESIVCEEAFSKVFSCGVRRGAEAMA